MLLRHYDFKFLGTIISALLKWDDNLKSPC